jgi:UDP-N-acetylmuramoyl-L-alanyl-D-glutamate--2,6-diaminopimelate ligase
MWQRIKNYYHLFDAVAAHVRYGFPYRGMTIIGVTGTDGKTTTSSLIYHLLKTSGYKTAMITTVGAYIGNKVYDVGFHVTTPSSDALFSYIQRARNEGITHLVLETTSHALDQYRVWGIPIHIAVLTNITHEHLDYHKTYARYVKAKLRLLKLAHTVVLNKDDQSFAIVSPQLAKKNIITYAVTDTTAQYNPTTYRWKRPMLGDFNARNTLAAIAVAKKIGISDASIRIALDTYKPPKGRLDLVHDGSFRVIIDFAHTPNAFLQVLPAVKHETDGRVIHVFGSAGLRDHTKRPLMGGGHSA